MESHSKFRAGLPPYISDESHKYPKGDIRPCLRCRTLTHHPQALCGKCLSEDRAGYTMDSLREERD
jgi:hypothetical protein